jgi:hypothetical protein
MIAQGLNGLISRLYLQFSPAEMVMILSTLFARPPCLIRIAFIGLKSN